MGLALGGGRREENCAALPVCLSGGDGLSRRLADPRQTFVRPCPLIISSRCKQRGQLCAYIFAVVVQRHALVALRCMPSLWLVRHQSFDAVALFPLRYVDIVFLLGPRFAGAASLP